MQIKVGDLCKNAKMTRFFEIVFVNINPVYLDSTLIVKVYNSQEDKETIENIPISEFQSYLSSGWVSKIS